MATVTVGSGLDYATVSAAENDFDNGAVHTAGNPIVVDVNKDGTPYGYFGDVNGGATLGVSSITIQPRTGSEPTGVSDGGPRFVSSSTSEISTSIPVSIIGMEFDGNGGGVTDTEGLLYITAGDLIVRRCILQNINRTSGSHSLIRITNALSGIKLSNTIAYYIRSSATNASKSNFLVSHALGGAAQGHFVGLSLYNAVRVAGANQSACFNGESGGSQYDYVRNVVGMDGDTADFQNNGGGDTYQNYNCSSDTTAPGTNSLKSKVASSQWVDTTVGIEDLNIINTSADIYDAGTDTSALVADSEFDAAFYERTTTWSMGALEYQSAGGTPAAITPVVLDLALPSLSSSFRLSASISPLSFDLTLPNLSSAFNQAGAISPLSLDLTLPSISAAFRQSASLTPLNLDLAFTELVGSTTSGESLTVLGLDLALPSMSASFKQAASISPLSLDLMQPAMFAAHHTGADLDPLSFDLALPEMSAAFQQAAAIAPLVLDFNLPDLSATGGTGELLKISQLEFVLPTMFAVHRESAQISPLALTLTQPEHFSGHHVTADLGALSLDLALPAITSTFRLDAAITPLSLEFTQPAITSGYRLAAAITPLALEFTQPAISATQAFVVTLDPLGFELALPDLSESHSLRADIGPLLFELALPVMIGVSPSFTLGQLAVLEGASLQIVTLAGASMETAVLNGT